MKVRPKLALDAKKIETEEHASRVMMARSPGGSIEHAKVGDWIITPPGGEPFGWAGETFEATYEVLDEPGALTPQEEHGRPIVRLDASPALREAAAAALNGKRGWVAIVAETDLTSAAVIDRCDHLRGEMVQPNTLMVPPQGAMSATMIVRHKDYAGPRLTVMQCAWLAPFPKGWLVAHVVPGEVHGGLGQGVDLGRRVVGQLDVADHGLADRQVVRAPGDAQVVVRLPPA